MLAYCIIDIEFAVKWPATVVRLAKKGSARALAFLKKRAGPLVLALAPHDFPTANGADTSRTIFEAASYSSHETEQLCAMQASIS